MSQLRTQNHEYIAVRRNEYVSAHKIGNFVTYQFEDTMVLFLLDCELSKFTFPPTHPSLFDTNRLDFYIAKILYRGAEEEGQVMSVQGSTTGLGKTSLGNMMLSMHDR
jgi:hypothetical protein